jgi:voltage-gated potassium channel
MKSWLQDNDVYHGIMNSALCVVVFAALATGEWPQFSWVGGSITLIAVVIAASVYWISVSEDYAPEDRQVAPQIEQSSSQQNFARLYHLLQRETRDPAARVFRGAHHAMVAAGIGVMLADTVVKWREAYASALDAGFQIVCAFFFAEYVLRLKAAPGAPGATHRGKWPSRLAWATSLGGIFDFLGALPGVLDVVFNPGYASLFGFIWVFKLVRYSPGLASLERVISNARQALLSVLLGFGIFFLLAASLIYLTEHLSQPEVFGSIPAALWAIFTMMTTGYGDVMPHSGLGQTLAGTVMIGGVLVLVLWASILATSYFDETRRHQFLQTWNLVAKVPFFRDSGAAAIAEVAHLLRLRDYPAGAVIMRRGERGDSMYFVASGELELRGRLEPISLGAGDFFGELALLTEAPRNATIVTTQSSTLFSLDIADFRQLLGREPDLARVIHEEAARRLRTDLERADSQRSQTTDQVGRGADW